MLGDCLEQLKKLTDDSVDSIVTDPPYELGFMGKKWDSSGIAYNVELWQECLRVLKPGGHLLAFSGSRTYHRMTVAIEDAGFEIRDQIMWVYGSGYPKSLNISKAISKDTCVGLCTCTGHKPSDVINKHGGTYGQEIYNNRRNEIPVGDNDGQSDRIVPKLSQQSGEQNAENIIIDTNRNGNKKRNVNSKYICPDCNNIRTDIGGTALKPAHEPICVARKPLIGTVAQNVLTHGTGGLNIDGCRVVTNDKTQRVNSGVEWGNRKDEYYEDREPQVFGSTLGRFPANLIHDGSDEVIGLFPETGKSTGGIAKAGKFNNKYGEFSGNNAGASAGGFEDAGSAARFFYCAKASKKDRNEGLDDFPDVLGGSLEGGNDTRDGKDQPQLRLTKNNHPTVKPTSLMRYLCKLITPPTGTVLDPFMGSGSTGKAAVLEGFNFIGIERDESYFEIATARIEHATKHGEKSDKKSNQSSTGSSNNTHFDDIFE